ncbi:hypothetical protein SOX05_08765 [Pseudomonas putida]|nr:hypothetical protein [Pseudomonas putida]MDY4319353.1 hypothetical protein [Pseudomonas putida]MDY4352738.1 hypothetical protein [Pseudomonas putida]
MSEPTTDKLTKLNHKRLVTESTIMGLLFLAASILFVKTAVHVFLYALIIGFSHYIGMAITLHVFGVKISSDHERESYYERIKTVKRMLPIHSETCSNVSFIMAFYFSFLVSLIIKFEINPSTVPLSIFSYSFVTVACVIAAILTHYNKRTLININECENGNK